MKQLDFDLWYRFDQYHYAHVLQYPWRMSISEDLFQRASGRSYPNARDQHILASIIWMLQC